MREIWKLLTDLELLLGGSASLKAGRNGFLVVHFEQPAEADRIGPHYYAVEVGINPAAFDDNPDVWTAFIQQSIEKQLPAPRGILGGT